MSHSVKKQGTGSGGNVVGKAPVWRAEQTRRSNDAAKAIRPTGKK